MRMEYRDLDVLERSQDVVVLEGNGIGGECYIRKKSWLDMWNVDEEMC